MRIVIKKDLKAHKILIHLILLIAGVTGLIVPARVSGTTLATLPLPSLYLFYGVLTVGGAGVLIGSFLRDLQGRLLLIYSLAIIALNLTGYGIAILGVLGIRGFFFGLLTIGIAAANLISIWQTWREIRAYQIGQQEIITRPDRPGEKQ